MLVMVRASSAAAIDVMKKGEVRHSSIGQLNKPYGKAVDSPGNIIVADTCNERLQVSCSAGSFLHWLG